MKQDNEEIDSFLERIHKEKLESQKRRASFNVRKFLFVGLLFSAGAAKLPKEIDLALVLYIVPFISFCFDLFILGEDYGIKRIGGFIRLHASANIDSKWEDWVSKRRDPFTFFAVPLLSSVVLVACIAVLWPREHTKAVFTFWILLNCAATICISVFSQILKKRLLVNNKPERRKKHVTRPGMTERRTKVHDYGNGNGS